MAITVSITPAMNALGTLAATTWDFPDGSPILETGDDPLRPSDLGLVNFPIPMCILQTLSEAPIGPAATGGRPARSRNTVVETLVWLVDYKDSGTRAIVTFRDKLATFGAAVALETDRANGAPLSDTVTNIEVAGMNWSGLGSKPPVDLPDPSSGVLAGYIKVVFELQEGFDVYIPPTPGDDVTRGPLTDRSGTITTGGTAQSLAASNTARSYLMIQNPSGATESLWVNFFGSASTAAPSTEISPGGNLVFQETFIPTQAVSVYAVTTGHAFTAWEG